MKKINTLFLQATPHIGGDSIMHALIMQSLARHQIEVHVAATSGRGPTRPPTFQALMTIPTIHLRSTFLGATDGLRSKSTAAKALIMEGPAIAGSLAALARYARRHQVDVVHCLERPRDAFYGLLLARLAGAKCVIHVHAKVAPWFSPLTLRAMKHADGLVGVSQFVVDSIRAMGYDSDRTYCVLNGIDLSKWDPTTDGRAIRQEFNIAPTTPLLVMIARLSYWKGPAQLLQALAKIKASGAPFRTLIVGEEDVSGPPGLGRSMADLRAMARDLGLAEQVTFTGQRRDIAQILAASDIYTMPSVEEPFGMVYLEAMAMQKPVVALRSGGVPEFVEHGKTGFLSEPQNIDQFAERVLALLHNPAQRHEMGAYARRQVEQFFTIERIGHDMNRIYRHVLGIH